MGCPDVELVDIRPFHVRVVLGQRRHAEVGGDRGKVDLASRRQIDAAFRPLRDVVAVQVGPRRRERVEVLRRVEQRRKRCRGRGLVPVEAKADRRLAGAEDVEHRAEARRECLPGRDVEVVERENIGEPPNLFGLTDDAFTDVLPASPDREGRSLQRPDVLTVESEVRMQPLRVPHRRVEDRDRERPPARVVLVEIGIGRVGVSENAPRILESELETVGAGDI